MITLLGSYQFTFGIMCYTKFGQWISGQGQIYMPPPLLNCRGIKTLMPPLCMSATLFSNVNNIQSMIPKDQKNKTTQWCSMGRHFTAAKHLMPANLKSCYGSWPADDLDNLCVFLCWTLQRLSPGGDVVEQILNLVCKMPTWSEYHIQQLQSVMKV